MASPRFCWASATASPPDSSAFASRLARHRRKKRAWLVTPPQAHRGVSWGPASISWDSPILASTRWSVGCSGMRRSLTGTESPSRFPAAHSAQPPADPAQKSSPAQEARPAGRRATASPRPQAQLPSRTRPRLPARQLRRQCAYRGRRTSRDRIAQRGGAGRSGGCRPVNCACARGPARPARSVRPSTAGHQRARWVVLSGAGAVIPSIVTTRCELPICLTAWRIANGGPLPGSPHSRSEKRSHADCRVISSASPIRAQDTPRLRTRRTQVVRLPSTWSATAAIRGSWSSSC